MKLLGLLLLLLLFVITPAIAKCHGNFVNPLTDICWSCIFPLSIGAGKVVGSNNPDPPNPKWPVCSCGSPVPRIGITVGYWEPMALVDVTRHPYCMVN
jgi:conjugal transfer pilus assembly protein TraU